MKIQINNYFINTKDLTTLFPPSKYILAQKNSGVSVINLYSAMSFEPFQRYISRFWAILYNTKYLIIYDDPDITDNNLVKKAVSFAFKNGITVFYRSRENCLSGLSPAYTELTKQNNIYHSRPNNQYDYMGSYYTEAPENKKFPKVKDTAKAKLRRYFTYYDITRPETEYDWYLAAKQIIFYTKNKIPTAFDKNNYYICPECKELILRGTEEEHICYCEIVPERTHMDYLLNGEE